ncbi:MAG: transglutaminase domain-containing protein [Sarcina sp.]
MKKLSKIISTLTAITTISASSSPIIQNTLAKANDNNLLVYSTEENSNSIYTDSINIENVWKQPLFTINFNSDNTLRITNGWSEINPYSPDSFVFTISNGSREILKQIKLKGGTYPQSEIDSQLDGFTFNEGDIITLSSKTGTEYFINKQNEQTGTVSYKITNKGLIQITAKAENVTALYDGNGKVDFSCKISPNSSVYIEDNGQYFKADSNSDGLVNTTIEGSLGDTLNIYPTNELESTTTVTLNKADFILQSQNISVTNVWNQALFTMGFNANNQFIIKEGWSETNPYYTGNNSLTVQLLDSKGQEISQQILAGGEHSTAISDMLNGKTFQYGDIIHIQSNSGAHITVGSDVYKDNVYLKLNQKGIEYLPCNNDSYTAEYNGNYTEVTGRTLDNSTMTIIANGKDYTITADNNGFFKLKLPNTIKVGDEISFRDSQGVTQSIAVVFNKASFQILNSKLEVINDWNTDAINLTFNPKTMTIETNGFNKYLGSDNGNPFLYFSLYDKNGNTLKNLMLKGSDNTSSLANQLSGLGFNFGDIIALSFDSSQGQIKVYNGNNQLGNKTGSLEYFEITPEGLVEKTLNTTINPLNILTSSDTFTINVSGKTTANTEITIDCNGKSFQGTSDNNGNFKIPINSATKFTLNTAITVKANNQIPQVVYPSASNMLEENSGVYFSGEGEYYGKILFNPITMTINWFDANSNINPVDNNPTTYKPQITPSNLSTVIDSKIGNTNALSIKITTKAGKELLTSSFSGNSTLGDIYNTINGKKFQYGDIVTITQNFGAIACNVVSNGKIVMPHNQVISFKITPNGLVDAIKGQSVYLPAFTPEDYYSNVQKGIVSTGITASGWDDGSEKLADNMVMSEAMKERVNEAIKNCNNDYEKAQAIFNIVSPVPYRNVGGNTINTYNNGGVCFNKAQLYAVMCQYAGIVSRLVTGYANNPSDYQRYLGYHSWNQVWIPSEDRWVTVDTTWHIFNCNDYVNDTRHSFSVQATLWNPKESYTDYFKNDPEMAWYHTGEVWNHADYYNFNLGNDPQFRNLFKGVTPSSISLENQYGWNSATIYFNGENDSFVVNGTEYNADGAVTINLVDPSTGSIIFSDSIKRTESTNDLAKEFKGEHYKIGDVLEILTDSGNASKLKVVGDGKVISDGTERQLFKITNDGLVPFSFNKATTATATATTGINNEGFYKATIEGNTAINQVVTIDVNGESFKTKSNQDGNFKLEIHTKNPMKKSSIIYINAWGAKEGKINPTVTETPELEDSSIIINDVWNYNLGIIGFNTNEMKLTDKLGWYETNPYLSSEAEAFSISFNKSTGEQLEYLEAMGSDPIPSKLKEKFNNKSFNYGDFIQINYKTSAKLTIKNLWVNGKLESSYLIKDNIKLYLTPKGLSTTINP